MAEGRRGRALGQLVHLRLDADEHHPLLVRRRLVVDDLSVVERRVAVEDLLRLRLALHRPMEDGARGHHRHGRRRDPLPEDHRLGELVRLHLRFHVHIEDLQVVAGLERDHLGNRIHDRGIGGDGTARRLRRSRHVDDHHLHLPIHLLADANVLLALHCERGEANELRIDAHIGELDQLRGRASRRRRQRSDRGGEGLSATCAATPAPAEEESRADQGRWSRAQQTS